MKCRYYGHAAIVSMRVLVPTHGNQCGMTLCVCVVRGGSKRMWFTDKFKKQNRAKVIAAMKDQDWQTATTIAVKAGIHPRSAGALLTLCVDARLVEFKCTMRNSRPATLYRLRNQNSNKGDRDV